jgi:aspartyl-tRNA synthetase
MNDQLATAYRTLPAGSLRAEHAGTQVRLAGWVHRRRDLGGLVFLDLRDRAGRVQLSFGPDWTPHDVLERARRVGAEWVIAVDGTVVQRPAGNVNTELATGEVEVHVTGFDALSEADTPPIPIAPGPADELPAEELRLRYRYLDLRREQFLHALGVRHRALQAARRHLSEQGFWEIETPMLTRRTPEGARDYLVPSRLHPGEFYALPQSPQLYKQLLMVSGYDRYFQIARCLRDEDLRADRQPEFTQIDAEMSFVTEEDVYRVGEGLMAALWREVAGVEIPLPFPRLTFAEAIAKYGTDKPDLRPGMEFIDLTGFLQQLDFRLFQATLANADRIRGIRVPGGAALSRKELDDLTPIARTHGAAGALWLRRTDAGFAGPFAKAMAEGQGAALEQLTDMHAGDLLVLVIGRFRGAGSSLPGAETALSALRLHLADRLGLRDPDRHAWLWVTQFPLFEWDENAGRFMAAHHPFTSPHPDDLDTLRRLVEAGFIDRGGEGAPETDVNAALALRSRAYDAVYNGWEMASGSIRIHDPALQRLVFRALGIGAREAEAKFGFLLEAFRYGAPPHGGFAFGFDRLVLLLAGGGHSLRDVIAFPKTTAARALFEGAPSPVSVDDLRELHIAPLGV